MMPSERATDLPIVVGLVNGMPGEARKRTERQFRSLLASASGRRLVELKLFLLEGTGASDGDPRYQPLESIADAQPDALIVTGMPPRTASLIEEASWPRLASLIDYAVDRSVPAIWSCLAAHAAVLHLDGIERSRLPGKLSGLVECVCTDPAHALARHLPSHWQAPHSRYNDLPPDQLCSHGYRMLSRAEEGADLFYKDFGAPFLFCQGHPEYEADTLLREYRRDFAAYLDGTREIPPDRPCNYFGAVETALLDGFSWVALVRRNPAVMEQFPFDACAERLAACWRGAAVTLYDNWLGLVAAHRRTRAALRQSMPYATPSHGSQPLIEAGLDFPIFAPEL